MLLAEAAVRWPGELGNIDVKSCIKKAIDASTRFYYNVNKTMSYNESSLPSILYVQAKAKAPELDEDHLINNAMVMIQNNFNLDGIIIINRHNEELAATSLLV